MTGEIMIAFFARYRQNGVGWDGSEGISDMEVASIS